LRGKERERDRDRVRPRARSRECREPLRYLLAFLSTEVLLLLRLSERDLERDGDGLLDMLESDESDLVSSEGRFGDFFIGFSSGFGVVLRKLILSLLNKRILKPLK
jgi:hypothetical protein